MTEDNLYAGREQTLVKHLILQRYLKRFAMIIGQVWSSITYVDCFSGPWQSRSAEFADTSFGIAVQELRRARDELAERSGKAPQLRCYFLERDADAYERLHGYARTFTDVEIATRNAPLEDSVADIERFVTGVTPKPFSFVFVDPTGWSGFALDRIRPLLLLKPGEVLINFMTEHIRRFIDSPDEQTRRSFEELFGSADFRDQLAEIPVTERRDAVVFEYARTVAAVGRFDYPSIAVVLHPQKNRSHFHLVYLTRSSKGLEVFKDAEKQSMADMEQARAKAQQRKREEKGGRYLFSAEEMHDPVHFQELRDRYLGMARKALESRLRNQIRVPYEQAWAIALFYPMVWEGDVKQWIREWTEQGSVSLEGLGPRQRVPQRDQHHCLVWPSGR
ncbi:MAG: three-Cys-motif partner protein TcmP [Pirellulaceae bacterium]|nr:three-Cys-motif partner protein TcmP [Pirellulaceae bacterium]